MTSLTVWNVWAAAVRSVSNLLLQKGSFSDTSQTSLPHLLPLFSINGGVVVRLIHSLLPGRIYQLVSLLQHLSLRTRSQSPGVGLQAGGGLKLHSVFAVTCTCLAHFPHLLTTLLLQLHPSLVLLSYALKSQSHQGTGRELRRQTWKAFHLPTVAPSVFPWAAPSCRTSHSIPQFC